MKQITIISGKGGTGKTTITAALATLAENAVFADCDVDAADLHLILDPAIEHEQDFIGGQVAFIDPEACTQCGVCLQHCRFEAIKDFRVDPISCEGCKVCTFACPNDAVSMKDKISGRWFISNTRSGPMVHAKLGIAEDNSGKLVSTVRQQAKKIAEETKKEMIIIDGPPGIGCPVIAAMTGVDLVLVVTEPTLSGLHDMRRVLDTAGHFKIPAMVCINKFDINPGNTALIEKECAGRNIPVCGRLPYDKSVTAAMIRKKSIIEHDCGQVTDMVKTVWGVIKERLYMH